MRKAYHQYCGLARALDLVGERWTLLVLRNLLIGPQSYTELHRRLPGITTNLLAKRLHEMIESDLIFKQGRSYEISPFGLELEPAIMALGAFGQRHLLAEPQPEDTVDVGWAMVSFKRRYRGQQSGRARLSLGEDVFLVDYAPDYVRTLRKSETDSRPAVEVSGSLDRMLGWLLGNRKPQQLKIEGTGFLKFCLSFGLKTGDT